MHLKVEFLELVIHDDFNYTLIIDHSKTRTFIDLDEARQFFIKNLNNLDTTKEFLIIHNCAYGEICPLSKNPELRFIGKYEFTKQCDVLDVFPNRISELENIIRTGN